MAAGRFVLLGPTASGKTAVSLPLAERLDAEIIAVDSRQLFAGMEIGSAAPTAAERARVPHHLVSVVDPREGMTAGEFGRRARRIAKEIESRGKAVLFVGGSGLYLRAVRGGLDEDLPRDDGVRDRLRERLVTEGAPALHAELMERDPETAGSLSARDAQRITRALEILELTGQPPSGLRTRGRGSEEEIPIAVLDREREDLEERIRARVDAMIAGGLEAEVRALVESGIDPAAPVLRSVGYAETLARHAGELDREAWIERIVINTRRYAKRQRTWFRGIETAVWFPVPAAESPGETAARVVAAWKPAEA